MNATLQRSAEVTKTPKYLTLQEVNEAREAHKESKEKGPWAKTKEFVVGTWNNVLKGAEEDYKNKEYGKLAVKGVLGLGAAWLTKEVIQTTWEGVKGVFNWTEEKIGGVEKDTQSSLLKSALKLILPAGALGGLIGVIGKSDLSISKILSLATNPAELAKYLLEEAKKGGIKLTGELEKWVKKKVKNIASLGDKSVKESLNVYEKDPRLENLWNIGVTRLQGIIGLTGVNASFLDGMKAEVPKMLSDAGVTPDMLEEINKGKTPSGLPQWLGPVVALGVPTIIGVIMARYLLSPGRLLKLGLKGAPAMALVGGMYLMLRSNNVQAGSIDSDLLSESQKKVLDKMGVGNKAGEWLKLLKDNEAMEKASKFISYVQEKAKDFYGDLRNLPGFEHVMPSMTDIKNLNPFNLIALMSENDMGSQEAKTGLKEFGFSAAKLGFLGLVFTKTGPKTKLTGLAIFATYCLYKDGKENSELREGDIPTDFFSKTGLEYVVFQSIDQMQEYGHEFYDTFLSQLKNKKPELVNAIIRLKNEDITPFSREWLTRVHEILKKEGGVSIILTSAGISLIQPTGELIFNANVNFVSGLGKSFLGFFSEKNTDLMSQGGLQIGETMIPFLVLGGFLDPGDPIEKAVKLESWALNAGIGSIVAGVTVASNLDKAKRFITLPVNGVEFVMEKAAGKSGGWDTRSAVRQRYNARLYNGSAGKVLKFINGAGWLYVGTKAASGIRDIVTGVGHGNDEVGEIKREQGYTKISEAGTLAALIHWGKKTQRAGQIARTAGTAISATGPGALVGWVPIAAGTLVEVLSETVLAGLESAEDMARNIKDWAKEDRDYLMHHLILTSDTRTLGDALASDDTIKKKEQIRSKILSVLIMSDVLSVKENSGINNSVLKLRLTYIQNHTENFNVNDQNHLNELLNDSRLYVKAMVSYSAKNSDVTIASMDKFDANKMDSVIVEYQQEKKLIKNEIPTKIFQIFQKLNNTELIHLSNQLELFFIRYKKEEKESAWKVYENLTLYMEYKNIHFIPDLTQNLNEKQVNDFVYSLLQNELNKDAIYSHIDNNPLAFALYELAAGFGYIGQGKMEDLKKFFDEDHAYARAIYWDGDDWVVQEAGMESDDEIGSSNVYKFIFGKDDPKDIVNEMIAKIESDKGNILEYTHDNFLDLGVSGTYDSRKEQEQWIANSLKTGLKKYDNFSK
jgi:hypothetical protein